MRRAVTAIADGVAVTVNDNAGLAGRVVLDEAALAVASLHIEAAAALTGVPVSRVRALGGYLGCYLYGRHSAVLLTNESMEK
jgi:hypothetical protein